MFQVHGLSGPEQFKEAASYFNHLFFDFLEKNSSGQGPYCWIAGGCLRDYFSMGYTKTDIDVFFPSKAHFDIVKDHLINKQGFKQVFENERVVRLTHNGHDYDIIKLFFDTPFSCLEAFDFTVCCCAMTQNELTYHETFFMDLAKRRLVINSLTTPLSTLQRLQKYILKGYLACNGTLLSIAKAINELDLNDKSQNRIEFYSDGRPRFVKFD